MSDSEKKPEENNDSKVEDKPKEQAGSEINFTDDPDVTFTSFLASLSSQALIQMGELPCPEGVGIPIDKDAAKQTINLLEVMKAKTTNNLNSQEEYFLEEMLHNLRLTFIKNN